MTKAQFIPSSPATVSNGFESFRLPRSGTLKRTSRHRIPVASFSVQESELPATMSVEIPTSQTRKLENDMAGLEPYIAPDHRPEVLTLLEDRLSIVSQLLAAIHAIEAHDSVLSVVIEADQRYGGPPIILGVSTSLDIDAILAEETRFWQDPEHSALAGDVLLTMDR